MAKERALALRDHAQRMADELGPHPAPGMIRTSRGWRPDPRSLEQRNRFLARERYYAEALVRLAHGDCSVISLALHLVHGGWSETCQLLDLARAMSIDGAGSRSGDIPEASPKER